MADVMDTGLSPKEKFLSKVRRRLKRCVDLERHNRDNAVSDLEFSRCEPGDQWDPEVYNARRADKRPALQFDILTENIDRMVGDGRMNRVQIKVRPVDAESDVNIAKIRQGIISNIEYHSAADRIYDYALEMIARGGYGAWQVRTRYIAENPFLQEVFIERIKNPLQAYLDPDAKDECKADAKYGFLLEKIPREEFNERYPNAEVPSEAMDAGPGSDESEWFDTESITIADYFEKVGEDVKMALLSDGRSMEMDDAQEAIAKNEADTVAIMMGYQQAAMMNPAAPAPNIPPLTIAKTRTMKKYTIRHWTVTGNDILPSDGNKVDDDDDEGSSLLKGEKVAGAYIPIVIATGPEFNIKGKPYVRSLIRTAKDPAKNYNYWNSAAAETIALAPKAPWVGTARQFEGYENDYAQAHVKNFPYLKYNVDDNEGDGYAGGSYVPPPPQRQQPGQPPVAMFQQVTNAKQAVHDALGMHHRDIGDVGPERTGAAVMAVQRPSEIGNFAFFDNLRRAVEHTGRVINSMIPEVYDSERDIRIRSIDETEYTVPVNTTLQRALESMKTNPERYKGINPQTLASQMKQGDAKFNDLTVGKYDIVSTTGPSYATQRVESADAMIKLAQFDPKVTQFGDDLLVKAMDFLYADELSDRLKSTLPPGLVPPKEGEPAKPPLPPTPDQTLKMEETKYAQMKQVTEQMKLKLTAIKVLKETTESQAEIRTMILDVLGEVFGTTPPTMETGGAGGGATLQPPSPVPNTNQTGGSNGPSY